MYTSTEGGTCFDLLAFIDKFELQNLNAQIKFFFVKKDVKKLYKK